MALHCFEIHTVIKSISDRNNSKLHQFNLIKASEMSQPDMAQKSDGDDDDTATTTDDDNNKNSLA